MRAGFLSGIVCLVLLGCGGNNTKLFDNDSGDDPFITDSGDNSDSGTMLGEAGVIDTGAADTGPPPEVAVVYGHSPSVLYKLDPKTKAVTTVGTFNCTSSVIDLAIDENSKGYMTTFSGFYSVNLANAQCQMIAQGNYPNSLSFVPKGTLDPNAEALVGYFGSQYVRINIQTGAITNVGTLTGGYTSSGDIVSVKMGGTFLTVKGTNCSDCLLQVDPKTGNVIQNYGSLGFTDVFGIAYWGGTVYGFTNAGQLFQVTAQNMMIKTTVIPIPNAPNGLQFWGAGSSTSNPTTGNDGGIPVN